MGGGGWSRADPVAHQQTRARFFRSGRRRRAHVPPPHARGAPQSTRKSTGRLTLTPSQHCPAPRRGRTCPRACPRSSTRPCSGSPGGGTGSVDDMYRPRRRGARAALRTAARAQAASRDRLAHQQQNALHTQGGLGSNCVYVARVFWRMEEVTGNDRLVSREAAEGSRGTSTKTRCRSGRRRRALRTRGRSSRRARRCSTPTSSCAPRWPARALRVPGAGRTATRGATTWGAGRDADRGAEPAAVAGSQRARPAAAARGTQTGAARASSAARGRRAAAPGGGRLARGRRSAAPTRTWSSPTSTSCARSRGRARRLDRRRTGHRRRERVGAHALAGRRPARPLNSRPRFWRVGRRGGSPAAASPASFHAAPPPPLCTPAKT